MDGISKEKSVCQNSQSKFRYLRINFVQIAHEGTSFVKIKGENGEEMSVGFQVDTSNTECV